MTKPNQKKQKKQQNQKRNLTIALLGILGAIILMMAFTPLGYLKVGAISISFLMIPVAIGAIAMGPYAGAALGGLFGITSFAQCFGMDAFGTFLLDVNPIFTFIVCILARALAGFLTGLISDALKKVFAQKRPIAYALTGLSAALLNTILFVGSLLLFFWNNTDFIAKMGEWGFNTATIFKSFAAFVGINALVEAAAALFVTCAIATALKSAGLIDQGEQ